MRVWLISFESKHVKKVGGLAEVPPLIARALSELGHEAAVITPSHGERLGGRVVAEAEGALGKYAVREVWAGGVKHYVVEGGPLEEREVYGEGLYKKALALAEAVAAFYASELEKGAPPHVAHGNDWHSAPALLALNSASLKRGAGLRLVYHIHLLSRARVEREDLAQILGVSELRGALGRRGLDEYYEASGGLADRLASLASDAVVTVSGWYAREVKRFLGLNSPVEVLAVENASPWSHSDVLESVARAVGRQAGRAEARRWLFKALCSRPLAEIGEEHAAEAKRVLGYDPLSDTWHQCFEEEGPLVVMSGRLTRQKGYEVLLGSLERLFFKEPEAKVLLMAVPVRGSGPLLEKAASALRAFREGLRIVLGHVQPDAYRTAFYSADASAAPSLYEPFGLVALESMAAGTPVVASRTGGFLATVLDFREAGPQGTGLLVEPGDPRELADALSGVLGLMERGRADLPGGAQLTAGQAEVRRACVKRAEAFSWGRAVMKLLGAYGG